MLARKKIFVFILAQRIKVRSRGKAREPQPKRLARDEGGGKVQLVVGVCFDQTPRRDDLILA